MTRYLVPFVLLLGLALLYGCGIEECRFDPDCGGGIGGFCSENADCDTNFCCMDGSNCNGGMCTYTCRDNADCPDDMLCEHEKCFFRCAVDDECAVGMSCEHGNTICEWP